MYQMNNIYNADSYKAIKDIPDKSIDLIITDPPYLIETDRGGGFFSKNRTDRRTYSEDLKRMNISDDFDYSILDEFVRVLKKINMYIWCSNKQLYKITNYMKEKYNVFHTTLTWHKTNPLPVCNNSYLGDTEFCIFFRESGVKLNTTMETGKTYFITQVNKQDKELYEHPTIKPLEIIKTFIINSSNENDVVADFFLGSGTTCVASKELNRQYIGFEIDKHFYEIAQDRLNGITAKERKILDEGQVSIFDL